MGGHDYDAADIRIVEFDAHVRKQPGMYFGVGPDSPDLATRVLTRVLGDAFHPAAWVAPAHAPRVAGEVSGDLAFTVADDQAEALDPDGVPCPGYFGSLLGPARVGAAAAAALSTRTVVEVWRDGTALRQELAGLRPRSAPVPFPAPTNTGTRVSFELDPFFFGPGAAITGDLARVAVGCPDCGTQGGGRGRVEARDLRGRRPPRAG